MFIWQKILFCRMWWADDGLLRPQLAHHQPTFVGFILIIIVIAKAWAFCGLLNVVADGCVLAWNVTQTERKLPKISLRDSGRAQTDRHSVSCIVMQRAENVPDAFFRFARWKASLFAVFASESR
ncbi:hypothetical protein YN18_004641 [Salmonella enterica subsp. enterica]|nr:hypothetical protein [Salmonella enterica subsp. enterica]EFI4138251.1 hypothetical protein [Escherichia coli]